LVITKEKSDMFRNAVLNKDLHEISLWCVLMIGIRY
jgi:hypothetical protein